jgi:hypothetical protein
VRPEGLGNLINTSTSIYLKGRNTDGTNATFAMKWLQLWEDLSKKASKMATFRLQKIMSIHTLVFGFDSHSKEDERARKY